MNDNYPSAALTLQQKRYVALACALQDVAKACEQQAAAIDALVLAIKPIMDEQLGGIK